MDQIASTLKVVGVISSVISPLLSGREDADILSSTADINAQGQEARAAALLNQAKAERAKGARDARERVRRGKIAESRALALTGMSGGGVDDPSVVQNLATLAGNTEFERLTAMFEGESTARGVEDEAALVRHGAEQLRYEGGVRASAAKSKGRRKAFANALTGGVGLLDMFNSPSGGALGGGRSSPFSSNVSAAWT